jgi:transposase InsO family protein
LSEKRAEESPWRNRNGAPRYLVAQDTYYVDTIKGVGLIYQQTVIDTYGRAAFAKLYISKHAITSAHVLNDRVIPFIKQHEIPILRIPTDRASEFNGLPENHEYQLNIRLENIDHSKTKVRHPQSNGICERIHRTLQDEFYAVASRKKLYQDMEILIHNLDYWMKHYNKERPHSGRYCFGKTPMETFLVSLYLAHEKLLNQINPTDSIIHPDPFE